MIPSTASTKGVYLECSDGTHDKWWALLKTRDGWECWYGGIGKIHPKSTHYTEEQAAKKYAEKIGKGYKMKGEVGGYSDLVAIKEYGWNRFSLSEVKKASDRIIEEYRKTEKKNATKKNATNGFDFMAELRKV